MSAHMVRSGTSRALLSAIHMRYAFKKPFSPNMGSNPERINQQRHANLGDTIETLKLLVPNLPTKSLPKSLVSSNIILQFCPAHLEEINSYIPAVKGHVPYYGSCKLLQVLLGLLVGPFAKLHIQSIRPVLNGLVALEHILPYTVIPEANKIIVKWTTCSGAHGESSHGWAKMDTSLWKNEGGKITGIASLLASIRSKLKESKDTERVVSGIFVFELNEDNDQIIVHTVEDIDVLEKRDSQPVSALSAC